MRPLSRANSRSFTWAFRPALFRCCVFLLAACASASKPGANSTATPAPAPTPGGSIGARTSGLTRRDGFIPLYIDAAKGKLYLELPQDSLRVVLVTTQATGLGSNPIGIDRGSGGQSQIARFDRNGERVLVTFENWNYRTSATDNSAHARSVTEAFPPSTVASLPLVASA